MDTPTPQTPTPSIQPPQVPLETFLQAGSFQVEERITSLEVLKADARITQKLGSVGGSHTTGFREKGVGSPNHLQERTRNLGSEGHVWSHAEAAWELSRTRQETPS